MDLIREGLKQPFDNILGIVLHFLLVVIVSMLAAVIVLRIVPNRLTYRAKSTIVGFVVIVAIIVWVNRII